MHISLDREGTYIFSFLEDEELIEIFGKDIDILTDGKAVIPDSTINTVLYALKQSILEACKRLPSFGEFYS